MRRTMCVRCIVMKNVAQTTIGGLALLANKGGNIICKSASQNIIVESFGRHGYLLK